MAPNSLFKKIDVYPYGICIAVGVLSCIAVLFLYSKKRGIPQQLQDYIFFIGIFAIAFGFLSAKFFQAVYDWVDSGFKHFSFVGAGITAMGGFIGGAAIFLIAYFSLARFVFKGKKKNLHKKHLNELLAVAPICIVIAHAFGRVGCLMAGCCHGAYLGEDYVFGGIYMEGTTDGWGYYVPTQLYEALFLFLLFAVLSILYFKGCNIILPIYLISYGVWRMIIEFFRTDERGGFFLSLSPSQWMSILFLIIGIVMIIIYVCKKIPLFQKPKQAEEKQS
ncbi:MAG: prolipoprotein diacylglyceryl transferase [Clostridia bacterium]|nr:prolipoprotein diacylglyceryl transferase [Clostridia bacterium]